MEEEFKIQIKKWISDFRNDDSLYKASEIFYKLIAQQLENTGVARLRIDDIEKIKDDNRLYQLLRGLSKKFGEPVPQSFKENMFSVIENKSADYRLSNVRGHQTSSSLSFHSDRSDLSVLLYIRTSKGGKLRTVSFAEAVDELSLKYSSVLETLLQPFPFHLRSESLSPETEWQMRPILWQFDNFWRGYYIRRFIDDSQKLDNCPKMTKQQINALDVFDSVLDELTNEKAFQPSAGEILIMDNFKVMHAREEFFDIPGQKGRKAIRLWLANKYSEPLPEFMKPVTGSVLPSTYRGGISQAPEYLNKIGTYL